MNNLDDLYEEVTLAIFELEEAERKVSRLAEEIAKLTSPSSDEGCIARRSAVRTAVVGRDYERAKELVNRFLAEDGLDARLRREFQALLS